MYRRTFEFQVKAGSKHQRFGMISLNGKDKIRMIGMEEDSCLAVRDCIETDWHKGLKDTTEYKQVGQ